MLYSAIKPLFLYKHQSYIPLPRGDESMSTENAVFILSSTRQKAEALLCSDLIRYNPYYKLYYIDQYYRQKIGRKSVSKNESSILRKEFSGIKFQSTMKQVLPSNKLNMLKTERNVIINLGEWMSYYFQYRRVYSPQMMCQDYISFLNSKLMDMAFQPYDKTIIIDIADWFVTDRTGIAKLLGYTKKYLNNPLAILMACAYRYPDILKTLCKTDILIIDSKNRDFMKLDSTVLIKQKYSLIKSRLNTMEGLSKIIEEEKDEQKDENKGIVQANNEVIKKRIDIINVLKKNFLGDEPEDITDENNYNPSDNNEYKDYADKFENDDYGERKKSNDEEHEEIHIESPLDDDLDKSINEVLDENPELLSSKIDTNDAAREVSKVVRNKVYIASFMPSYTKDELQRLNDLKSEQEKTIGKLNLEDVQSKVIEETDMSSFVKTLNPNIVKSKFANFDKSYNNKKLEKDIDNSIRMLSTAEFPVFITGKEVVDSSDQLNLKKTYTYYLKDEKGRKFTLKFDIPIIIENNYLFLNGSKKIMEHQLVLKPIVKTGPDTVQIVSCYKKVFITRNGTVDANATLIKNYLLKNIGEYFVKMGNALVKNRGISTTIEFDIIAKYIYSFRVGDAVFLFDIPALKEELTKLNIKFDNIDNSHNLILGYNTKTRTPIYIDKKKDILSDVILSYFGSSAQKNIQSAKIAKKLMYSQATMLQISIPVILFLCFCVGFKEVMKRAHINYDFVKNEEDIRKYDDKKYGVTELNNGYIVWERYPLQNSLLMDGLFILPTSIYNYEDLENRETYIYMLTQFSNYAANAYNFDQFKDFLIDNISKEILTDFHLPTNIVDIFLYANNLLTTNDYKDVNNTENLRLRSNELIAFDVYQAVTSAYGPYRKTNYKKNPTKISMKQNVILSMIGQSKLSEDFSVLNPILEMEKNHAVTYKGTETGINLDEAMGIDKRAYDPTMLGVLGISTTPDANVGVLRQLTLEPKITSTRGYIDVTPKDKIDDLTSANLLTPAEMLTPMGIQHDDPTRTAMSYKQTEYMLLIKDSDPAMITNGVEKIIPYHMSNEFTIVAKDDGKVIENNHGIVVIEYKDGSHQAINLNLDIKKNSSSGFFVPSKMVCEKCNVGDKIKKGEVIAYNPNAFKKDKHDRSASMKLGALVKAAIVPDWTIYEDSAPITESASTKLITSMAAEETKAVKKSAFVDYIVQVGQEIKTGDPLLRFDNSYDDPEITQFLQNLQEASKDLKEQVVENNITTIYASHSGVIADIKIYTTVPLDDLSPTLKKIVSDYWKELKKKNDILKKYQNATDSKYYKCGNIISEETEPIKPDFQGKIKGVKVGEGVLFDIFISYEDRMAKGDKLSAEFALKSVNSYVIPKGLEPYSEYRPDEEIQFITSPLAVSARKVPSVFFALFGNKILIEAKRHAKEMYEKD
jgi:hypothetical protein